MEKIYLCTTFREFNGNKNSQIQDIFVNSILNQTYQNYKLIITTFGETTVKEYLSARFPSDKLIVLDQKKDGYRYSLTDVLINAVDNIDEQGVLIWCTCDIKLQSNYFETVRDMYGSNICGITHPNYVYYEDNKTVELEKLTHGIDILFFDTSLLKRSIVYSDIKEYRFVDWGIFEHFLCGIATKYSKYRVNTVNISNVVKYVNDRVANNESNQFFVDSLKKNRPVFERFLEDRKLSDKFSSLLYCHLKFKVCHINTAYIKHNLLDINNLITVFKLMVPNVFYKKIRKKREKKHE